MKSIVSILKWKTVTYLTILLSIMSLTSFLKRIFDFGLIPIIDTYVRYYHQISHAFIGMPLELVGIKMPSILMDFWMLSFICAGAYARSSNVEKALIFQKHNFTEPSLKLRLAIFFIAGFSGLSLFIPLSVLSINTYARDDITREALKNTGIVFIGTIAVFVLNAFGPSA